MRSRPSVLVAIAVMLALIAHGSTSARGAQRTGAADRPDIIVIMVDDLGYLDDDRIIKRLPNIRGVFRDGGKRFRQMYDETPLCCPARATFLTGRHTLHHGVTRNDGDLLDASTTVAVALDAAGYHTVQVGKYLNGYTGDHRPVGWDHTSLVRSQSHATFWRDGEAVSYSPQHVDQAISTQAIDLVRAAPRDQPLFGWIATSAPHACQSTGEALCYEPVVLASDRGADACADIPKFKPPSYRAWTTPQVFPREMPDWPAGWRLRSACESLLVVDRMVGQIVDTQAERDRPAWFVFMSDNGMSWGQKGFPQKHVPTATRLPFYVAGPGVTRSASDALLSNIDIAPTLADIGGADLPTADGTSFLPLLRGEPFTGHPYLLELQTTSHTTARIYWAAVRTREWRLIRWSTGRRELYRLSSDPWELTNLVTTNRPTANMLEARLDALLLASR